MVLTPTQMHKSTLCIFQEPLYLQPIISRTKNELEELFNSTAKFERLAIKSINDNPPIKDRYFLEPIPKEMFLMFADSENPTFEYDDSPNVIKLLSSGSLSVDNEEVIEEEAEPRVVVTPYSLDIESYRKRRAEQNKVIEVIDSSSSTVAMIAEDSTMTEANSEETPSVPAVAVEEEFSLNTQDVNEMIDTLIGPGSAETSTEVVPMVNGDTTAASTPVDSDQTAVSTPVDLDLPSLSTPIISEPPAVSTRVFSAPGMYANPIFPTPAAHSTTIISEPAAVSTRLDVELPAVSTPIISEPAAVPAPVDVELPTVSTPPATRVPSVNVDWISENTSTDQAVYTFPKKVIPVYATMEQRAECDKTVEAAKNKTNLFFNMHFEKSINSLNLPSSEVDFTHEEQWTVSGKLMVLKHLLNSLLDKDFILLIVVKDMGEEEMLIESIKNTLKLDCVRMNYVVQNWDGEYGVFVKTKSQVDQLRGTAERSSRFEPVADFIISLDIRAKSDEALSKVVTERDSSEFPPTASLISLGSIEERAFNYLEEHNLLISDANSDEFKNLMRENNNWPTNDDTTSIEELNIMVAENIKSWLLSSKRRDNSYQYRSLVSLPRSAILGAKEPERPAALVPTVVAAAEENGSDMDIESDVEGSPGSPLLSEEGEKFIKNTLFPLLDISKCELPQRDTVSILSSLPKSDIKKFEKLPPMMYTTYQNEVNALKRRYEEAFQDLQKQYREKAFEALRKP